MTALPYPHGDMMNTFLETAAMQTLTPIGPALIDIMADTVLASVFTNAPCSVCAANDLPTVGPTYHDSETGGQFCLGCLELACDPLPELPTDPESVAYAEEWIAARRAARTTA